MQKNGGRSGEFSTTLKGNSQCLGRRQNESWGSCLCRLEYHKIRKTKVILLMLELLVLDKVRLVILLDGFMMLKLGATYEPLVAGIFQPRI